MHLLRRLRPSAACALLCYARPRATCSMCSAAANHTWHLLLLLPLHARRPTHCSPAHSPRALPALIALQKLLHVLRCASVPVAQSVHAASCSPCLRNCLRTALLDLQLAHAADANIPTSPCMDCHCTLACTLWLLMLARYHDGLLALLVSGALCRRACCRAALIAPQPRCDPLLGNVCCYVCCCYCRCCILPLPVPYHPPNPPLTLHKIPYLQ